MKLIVLLISITVSFMSYANGMIPYKVLERSENKARTKLTYHLRVDVINNRLPSKEEFATISNHLVSMEKPHFRTWVFFYFPGMKIKAGSYATAHHTPKIKVKLMEYILHGTPYEKYLN